MDERTKLVQAGYDIISRVYHDRRQAREETNIAWLDGLRHLLPADGKTVDLGCGSGVPISRYFATRGYEVTGYDVSESMVQLAKGQVPEAEFEQAAIEELSFESGSIDLVLSFFAIIHLDRSRHAKLFQEIYRWLGPNGAALLSLGATDNPDEHNPNWHGAPMAWSHFGADKNLELLSNAGFDIAWSAVEEIAVGESHQFVVARKLAAC